MEFTVLNKLRRRVFISYSVGAEEQVDILHLQDLAAANGIRVYIPRRQPFDRAPRELVSSLPKEVMRAIVRSPFIFAIITRPVCLFVQSELSYAIEKKKLIVALVELTLPRATFLSKVPHVFRFSRCLNPEEIAAQVVEALEHEKVARKYERDLRCLTALTVALLSLSQ